MRLKSNWCAPREVERQRKFEIRLPALDQLSCSWVFTGEEGLGINYYLSKYGIHHFAGLLQN